MAEQETFVFQGLFHKEIASIYRSLDLQLAKDLLHSPENPVVKSILQRLENDEIAFRSYFPNQELNLFLNSVFRTFYDYVFNDYSTKKSELYLNFLRNLHNPLAFEEITPAFQELQRTIHGWLNEKYGLTASLWNPTQPIDDLLKTLREAGPLIVVGSFGKTYYIQPPLELKQEFSKKIQGWKSGTDRVMTSKSHTVILLGATKNPDVSGGGYVYFFDPHQPRDPQLLQNDLFYKISYQNLQTHFQRFELLPSYAVHLSKRGIETTPKKELLESKAASAFPLTTLLRQEQTSQGLQWDKTTVATLLWKDPRTVISEEMVKKIQFVTDYLQAEGFVLGGIAADGNCFLNAFLESYKTLFRKIPILDEQSDRVTYLRTCIAAEYPQDSAQNRERADQIKKDKEWITAQGEGDLLAKGLCIPIRIVTVHQDLSGWGISDMLTFPDKEISRKEWKTISEQDRSQEYIFIVDLGGHFLYAKKRD